MKIKPILNSLNEFRISMLKRFQDEDNLRAEDVSDHIAFIYIASVSDPDGKGANVSSSIDGSEQFIGNSLLAIAKDNDQFRKILMNVGMKILKIEAESGKIPSIVINLDDLQKNEDHNFKVCNCERCSKLRAN